MTRYLLKGNCKISELVLSLAISLFLSTLIIFTTLTFKKINVTYIYIISFLLFEACFFINICMLKWLAFIVISVCAVCWYIKMFFIDTKEENKISGIASNDEYYENIKNNYCNSLSEFKNKIKYYIDNSPITFRIPQRYYAYLQKTDDIFDENSNTIYYDIQQLQISDDLYKDDLYEDEQNVIEKSNDYMELNKRREALKISKDCQPKKINIVV